MEPLTVPNDGWYIVTSTDTNITTWDFGEVGDWLWIDEEAALLGISGTKEPPPPPDPFLNHYLE